MLNKKHMWLVLIIAMFFSDVFAQFDIQKYTINNGGGKMTGGSYEVQSSIGQTDASSTKLIGGGFSLSGGFWQENNDLIFKNGLE